MRRLQVLAVAALLVLAGCGGASGDPTATPTTTPTATPTTTPTTAPTATATATPTATPTATATATPTPTARPTPTATATATPEPAVVYGSIGQWANRQTQNTEVGYRVGSVTQTDVVDGMQAPDGQTWVVVDVWIRNTGSNEARIGWTQWQMEDFAGITRSPDREAMDNATNALDQSRIIGPKDGIRVRVIFATNSPDQPTLTITPYGNFDGPDIVVET